MRQTAEKVYKNNGNQELLGLIPDGQNVVLDIGCGGGDNGEILSHRGNIVDGITLSAEEAVIAGRKLNKVYVHNLEEGLPGGLQGNYDVVVMSHVLEHIAYPERLLTDIKKVLKTDGRLIIAIPNIMHYKSRIQLIIGRFNYEETGIWDYTHVRWYTINSIIRTLEKFEFEIDKVDVSGDVPAASIVRKYFSKGTIERLYRVFKWFSRELFGYQILVVASKRSYLVDE
jgi:SAM-dependent methyltransferase